MTHTKTLVAGLYQTSALPSLAAFGSEGPVGSSACAVAYMGRTRGVIGRVNYGAIDGRGLYIRVVSSATWNSHTQAYMNLSHIAQIQHLLTTSDFGVQQDSSDHQHCPFMLR